MKIVLIAASIAVLAATTGCSRNVYVEVPVPVEVKKKSPAPQPTPRRYDNPDSFDAVQKPTTYSY